MKAARIALTILEWSVYIIVLGLLVMGITRAALASTEKVSTLEPIQAPVMWDRPAPRIVLASWLAKGLRDPEAMVACSNIHRKGQLLDLRLRPSDPWVRVKVHSFGPDPAVHPDRTLDVSLGVARKFGMVRPGLAFLEMREVHE